MKDGLREDIVVLGAGLTGLSFAYHMGGDVPVFEKESSVGGLTRTISRGPYKFDLAPHLLHFRSPEIRDLLIEEFGVPARQHARSARIYFEDALMAYPFELNLFSVSDNVRDDCVAGLDGLDPELRKHEDALRAGSFESYALQAFGPGICNHYLLPYNRKIWDIDPAAMTCEWMRFLPTADIEKIRKNAFAASDDAFGYNTKFYYPENGGMQDLAEAFARRLSRLTLGDAAVGLDLEDRKLRFASGRTIGYERLVSTLPLRDLARISGDSSLEQSADNLLSTHVYVINVCIRGRVPEGVHWIYFPDPALRFFRISFPKNYFDNSAPDGEHIIAVEVSSQEGIADLAALEALVIEQLKGLTIFDIREITYTYVHTIACAYCVYDIRRTPNTDEMLSRLEDFGVTSTGRYGLWEYSAMEDAIVYGRDLALKLTS